MVHYEMQYFPDAYNCKRVAWNKYDGTDKNILAFLKFFLSQVGSP